MSWQIPTRNEFVKVESVNRQLKKAKSPKTYANWKNQLYSFFKFIKN